MTDTQTIEHARGGVGTSTGRCYPFRLVTKAGLVPGVSVRVPGQAQWTHDDPH